MIHPQVVTPHKKASRLRDALDRLLVDCVHQVCISNTGRHGLVGRSVKAISGRGRTQAKRPPLAKIRPGRPAPTMGPGMVLTDPDSNMRLAGSGRLNSLAPVPAVVIGTTPPAS